MFVWLIFFLYKFLHYIYISTHPPSLLPFLPPSLPPYQELFLDVLGEEAHKASGRRKTPKGDDVAAAQPYIYSTPLFFSFNSLTRNYFLTFWERKRTKLQGGRRL